MKEIVKKVQAKLPSSIENDKDFDLAMRAVKYLRGHLKKAEAKRKQEVKPLLVKKREIDDSYKKFTEPAKAMITSVKSMIAEYYHQIDERQKKLEEDTAKKLKPGETALVVDIKDQLCNSGEAKVSVKKVAHYRFEDPELDKCFTIKQTYLKEYIKKYGQPDFIEGVLKDQTTIR